MLKRSNKQELIVSCKQEVAFWKARPVAKSFYIHNTRVLIQLTNIHGKHMKEL
jgi:hypothetical protein